MQIVREVMSCDVNDDISAYFVKVTSTIFTPYFNALLNFPFVLAYFLKTAHLLKSYLLTKKEVKQTQATIDLY